MAGLMSIMGPEGDTKIIWDSGKPEEVKTAKESFDRLTKKGYRAFSVKKSGEQGNMIDEFDPEAEKIILAAPISGG